MAKAKQDLNWTAFTLSNDAPSEVKDADVDMETAATMARDAKKVLGLYVATKVNVPAGYEVVVMRKFGEYRFALAPIPASRNKAAKVTL
jgi:hypothetical protein